ncbi:MAG: hypothetical protein KK482_28330 [Sinorhizobium meliloti]|nr:hypothetical protein [Sinorhizobium meliloti]
MARQAAVLTNGGGYLRDLTRRAARGEFSLGPMLMAVMRANGAPGPLGSVSSARSLRHCRWFPASNSSARRRIASSPIVTGQFPFATRTPFRLAPS